ncbi:helix-turn-helix domain-containing protein [Pseudarthrobacter sp. W1I19]|uniref:helix-turn-helix domain-containing protein n=1 Tax=Pseudarthrobacter sp. W1I19 TaxID=3042288 RepID=UPI0027D7DC6F|nr:helix-turn-helix domain-containing protein [Pseudarthrobacter sp. W1I19]
MASIAPLSTRQVSRLFASELRTSPTKFVEQVRLDHAKAMLDAGCWSLRHCRGPASGFGSTETMRRSFLARLRVSPSDYRARFSTTYAHLTLR